MRKLSVFFITLIVGLFSFSFSYAADAVSSFDVVNAVDQNRMRFDKQVKGKLLTIKGPIFKMEEKNGKYIVYIHGAQNKNPFKTIACEFGKAQEDALMNLNNGEEVTITGLYKGKQNFEMGALTLLDCKLD